MTDIDWGRLTISQEPDGLQLLGQTVSLWFRRLRERAELARFDERELRDIGVTEDMLPGFAEKAFSIKRLMRVNPRMPASADEILTIYRAAF